MAKISASNCTRIIISGLCPDHPGIVSDLGAMVGMASGHELIDDFTVCFDVPKSVPESELREMIGAAVLWGCTVSVATGK